MPTGLLRCLFVAMLTLALAACAAGAADQAPPPPARANNMAQTLEAHRWSLASVTDAQGRPLTALAPGPGRAFVFSFAGQRLNIRGGCNPMMGSFQLDAQGQLKVGRMASTMMACDPPTAMQADAALSELLAKPLQVELTAGAQPTLRLVSAAKETLLLTGQMTPEARYGASTLIFLEVAPQPVACNRPPMGNTSCLQVRERRFDERGLAAGAPGEWRPLYEPIEGFTHRTGERNVLRIKRFQRNPAPADASSNVYVLDLVVESEVVAR